MSYCRNTLPSASGMRCIATLRDSYAKLHPLDWRMPVFLRFERSIEDAFTFHGDAAA